MPRILPWRNSCPSLVVQRLHQLAASRLLLIHEKGPTSFVLKDANSSKKFTVGLGDVHSCTCSESRAEMCVHILYVLQKVFRIPAANPLLWQRSFMDAEVHDLVLARNRMRNLYRQQQFQIQRDRRMRRLAQGDDDNDDDDENSPTTNNNLNQNGKKPSNKVAAVERKALDADDSCPICCDAFNERDQQASRSASSCESLVWCRFGCGNSIHVECFRQYCQHHATRPEPLSCPLCRTKWGQLDAGDFGGDLPKHAAGTKCDACKADITYGERFRCCFCPRFDLCPQCYNTRPNVHAQHPFDIQSGPGARFLPAPPRPLPPTNQQFRNNNISNNNSNNNNSNGAVAIGTPVAPQLSSTALLSAGVTTIGEIFQQHSPNSRRSNGDNNNNNRGNSDASVGSFVLTMNEALRFSLPFDDAMEEYINKYFGVRLSGSNNNNDDQDGQDIANNDVSSETDEERMLMKIEKEIFKRNVSCPICLENFIEIDEGDLTESEKHAEKLIILPSCKHIFHLTCGTQWLSHGGAGCAFCKLPVSTLTLPTASHHNHHHHSISATVTATTPQRQPINSNHQSQQQQQQTRNQVRAHSLQRRHIVSTPLTSASTPNLIVIGGARGTTPSNNENNSNRTSTTTTTTTPRVDGENNNVVFPSPPNNPHQTQVIRGRPTVAPAPKSSSSSSRTFVGLGGGNTNNNNNSFNDFAGVIGLNATNVVESGTNGMQNQHQPAIRSNSTIAGKRTSLNPNTNIIRSNSRPKNNNNGNPSPVLSLDGILTAVGGGRANNNGDVRDQQSRVPPKPTVGSRSNNRENKPQQPPPPPPPSFSVAGKGGFTFFPAITNSSQN